jgi:Arc/MetJ-type ribon-helix-helix transcriptional regulator
MFYNRDACNKSVTVRVNSDMLAMVIEEHKAENFGQAEISDVVRTALTRYHDALQESKIRRDADMAKRDAEFAKELQKEKRKATKKRKPTPKSHRR